MKMKDVMKLAFAVSFGWRAGKLCYRVVETAIEKGCDAICVKAADAGNKNGIRYCEKYDIPYKGKKETDENIVGFHG